MASAVYTPSEVTEGDLKEMSVHSFDPTLSNHQKAYYHYLRGKLFNVFENYNASAEDNLCRAVKLNPKLIKAWKQLGECFWKKGDLEATENCFRWAVDIDDGPSSLTLLAMVQRRQMDLKSLESSIQLCKNALKIDMSFSEAWVGLGSSYMSMYFNVSRNSKDLKLALKAYDKAGTESTNPDMYQSRAIIHQYFENYEKAISDLNRAEQLDYRLNSEHIITSIRQFIQHLDELLSSKLNMSAESLYSLQARFPVQVVPSEVFIKPADGGAWTMKSTIRLYILKCVQRYNDAVGCSFIAMDSRGDLSVLTVLNITIGAIKVGDFVLAVSPVRVMLGDKPVIRIDDPHQIEVNNNRVSAAQMAWVEMKVEGKS